MTEENKKPEKKKEELEKKEEIVGTGMKEKKHEDETKKEEKKVKQDKPAEIKREKVKDDQKEQVDTEKQNDKKSKKTDEKTKEEKKVKKKESPKVKKEEAIARGDGLRMSKRHGMYICSFIKNKNIDTAIEELEKVKKMKIAIPFKGEIPHRKGDMMSGRYPVKAAGLFINLLKGLKGNVIVNGLDLDKTIIYYTKANLGHRPTRRGGLKGKRTNILLKAREMSIENKEGEKD